MFFGRNEIHIQAFAKIPPANLMSGDSSSSTFHDFHEFILYNYQKSWILKFKNSNKRNANVSNISKLSSCIFLRKIFSQCSQGCSLFFLDSIEVFWFNKMKKYGLPGPKTSIIHEMLSFRCLMPWNRDFISLAWRRKIQLRH